MALEMDLEMALYEKAGVTSWSTTTFPVTSGLVTSGLVHAQFTHATYTQGCNCRPPSGNISQCTAQLT